MKKIIPLMSFLMFLLFNSLMASNHNFTVLDNGNEDILVIGTLCPVCVRDGLCIVADDRYDIEVEFYFRAVTDLSAKYQYVTLELNFEGLDEVFIGHLTGETHEDPEWIDNMLDYPLDCPGEYYRGIVEINLSELCREYEEPNFYADISGIFLYQGIPIPGDSDIISCSGGEDGDEDEIAGIAGQVNVCCEDVFSTEFFPEGTLGDIKDGIAVGPNPVTKKLTILNLEDRDEVFLYDSNGVILYENNSVNEFELELDLTENRTGVYMISVIRDGERIFNERIVKI